MIYSIFPLNKNDLSTVASARIAAAALVVARTSGVTSTLSFLECVDVVEAMFNLVFELLLLSEILLLGDGQDGAVARAIETLTIELREEAELETSLGNLVTAFLDGHLERSQGMAAAVSASVGTRSEAASITSVGAAIASTERNTLMNSLRFAARHIIFINKIFFNPLAIYN